MVEEQPDAMISTRLLSRLIILLIAIWSFAAGLVLLGFANDGGGALGAGIADRAGQRLVGMHLLMLVPVYLLMVWRPDGLLSLPDRIKAKRQAREASAARAAVGAQA